MSIVDQLRERLQVRRVELQEELEVTLPEVERLRAEIVSQRQDMARLERRRDALAKWGSKPLEIPQGDSHVPFAGATITVEVEPLKSKLTGRELAAKVQPDIDYLVATIKASEKEIQRLMRGRS